MQECQQLLPLLRCQSAQTLRIPVDKDLMTDHKGVFTPLGQLQVVAAPILFFRQKAVFGQLVQAALGVAPIQMQIFGQFRRRTIRMLSYINDKYISPKLRPSSCSRWVV